MFEAGQAEVAVATAIFGALMAIRTVQGGDLQFDLLLQAMASQLGDQLPSCAASCSDARAPESALSMDEVGRGPRKLACTPPQKHPG